MGGTHLSGPQALAAFTQHVFEREKIQHFLITSQKYGYWNATPEENAEIGLTIPMTV